MDKRAFVIVSLVFLLTGLLTGWHGIQILLDTVNGRPWSDWSLIVLAGAGALLVASWFALTRKMRKTYMPALVGSTLLGLFYIPATIETLRSYFSNSPDVYGLSDVFQMLLAPILVAISIPLSVWLIRYRRG
jgi:divalent metal cation (Fe/Co/Zn/Cd) transporter